MGVNQCDRSGCMNIGCVKHSRVYGHICDDCLKELIVFLKVGSSVQLDIKKFMESPTGTLNEAIIEDLVKRIFD